MPYQHPDAEIRAIVDETMADLKAGRFLPPKVPWEWDLRRENELTTDYLGRVLEWAGALDLARNARRGHYDDFAAPADVADGFEIIRLVRDLRRLAEDPTGPDGTFYGFESMQRRRLTLAAIENAARHGEFDATEAESKRWAASKDGQQTFASLGGEASETFDGLLRSVGRNDKCPCGSGVKFKRCHGR